MSQVFYKSRGGVRFHYRADCIRTGEEVIQVRSVTQPPAHLICTTCKRVEADASFRDYTPLDVLTTCPPHHWFISNHVELEGTLEKWVCYRCGTIRERMVVRRVIPSNKRTITSEGHGYLAEKLG